MPLSTEFVQEMLLTYTIPTISATYVRMAEQLWPYSCDVMRRKSIVGNSEVEVNDPYTNRDSVVEIVAVLYDRTFIPRATESRLDALNPNWRNAPAGIPNCFLFSGETYPGKIRLYPAPAQVVDVVIMSLFQPFISDLIGWQRMYFVLRTVEFISSSDPVRARVNLSEFMKPFIAMIEQAVNSGLR